MKEYEQRLCLRSEGVPDIMWENLRRKMGDKELGRACASDFKPSSGRFLNRSPGSSLWHQDSSVPASEQSRFVISSQGVRGPGIYTPYSPRKLWQNCSQCSPDKLLLPICGRATATCPYRPPLPFHHGAAVFVPDSCCSSLSQFASFSQQVNHLTSSLSSPGLCTFKFSGSPLCSRMCFRVSKGEPRPHFTVSVRSAVLNWPLRASVLAPACRVAPY